MRSKKMVLLSHCLLNVNSKVEGFNPFAAMFKELLELLHEENYGIIQLPCPEIHLLGMRRWGVVKDQLSYPLARSEMLRLLEPIRYQLTAYLDAGYSIPFVIGVDGSPSCGVGFTCRSDRWRGEMSSLESLELFKDIRIVPEKGAYMELLEELLRTEGIAIEFLSVDEENPSESLDELRRRLRTF